MQDESLGGEEEWEAAASKAAKRKNKAQKQTRSPQTYVVVSAIRRSGVASPSVVRRFILSRCACSVKVLMRVLYLFWSSFGREGGGDVPPRWMAVDGRVWLIFFSSGV